MCQRGPPKIQIRNNAPKEVLFNALKGEDMKKHNILSKLKEFREK